MLPEEVIYSTHTKEYNDRFQLDTGQKGDVKDGAKGRFHPLVNPAWEKAKNGNVRLHPLVNHYPSLRNSPTIEKRKKERVL